MKKTMIFAALMMFGVSAYADSVKVKVTGGSSPLPLGDYTISTVPGSESVLVAEAAGKKRFVFGRLVRSIDGKTKVELTGKPAAPLMTASIN